jgi:hypothetical protein
VMCNDSLEFTESVVSHSFSIGSFVVVLFQAVHGVKKGENLGWMGIVGVRGGGQRLTSLLFVLESIVAMGDLTLSAFRSSR